MDYKNDTTLAATKKFGVQIQALNVPDEIKDVYSNVGSHSQQCENGVDLGWRFSFFENSVYSFCGVCCHGVVLPRVCLHPRTAVQGPDVPRPKYHKTVRHALLSGCRYLLLRMVVFTCCLIANRSVYFFAEQSTEHRLLQQKYHWRKLGICQ